MILFTFEQGIDSGKWAPAKQDVKDYRRIHQENSAIKMFALDANGEINLKPLNTRRV